jgi:RNA polymerase sigma-70 factor, ECF subfamily
MTPLRSAAEPAAPPDAPVPDDRQLAARARVGDSDALASLYRRHADGLLAIAHRLTLSVADAEDVVQDLFVGLPEALGRYEERGQLGAWLRRIAVRLALMRLRGGRRRREVGLDTWHEPILHPPETEGEDALLRAVAALPVDLRAVFVLREVEGYSHQEIGEMLGIRRGTSEVRLYRAIRRLRRQLKGD